MARAYDVRCSDCGVNEVIATVDEARADALRCGYCGRPAPQFFASDRRFYASIENADEDARDPARVKDGTAKFNVGLFGRETVVGTRRDGKPKIAYRPIARNELPTNRAVREEAKRQGLTPVESGSFRAI